MEEKKKSNSGIIFMLLLIIVILLFAIFGMWYYYNIIEDEKNIDTNNEVESVVKSNTTIGNEKDEEDDENIININGKYVIDLESFESTESKEILGNMYGECGFTFDKNSVIMNAGWGTSSVGTYTIDNNKVECIFTKWVSEAGGYFEFTTEPVEFAFKIKDEDTLIVKDSKRKGDVIDVIVDENGNFGKDSIDYSDDECFANGAMFVKE